MLSFEINDGYDPHKNAQYKIIDGFAHIKIPNFQGMTLRIRQNKSAIARFTVVIKSLLIRHLTSEKRLHAYAAKRQASITQAYHRQSPLSSSNESAVKCSICM